MLFQLFSRIKFLLSSTNQHGVHSPFVFNFVIKGLYKKSIITNEIDKYLELNSLSKKEKKILSNIITYFNVKEFYFNTKSQISTLNNEFKLLYFRNLTEEEIINSNLLNENTILIFHQIYKSNKSLKLWNNFLKKQSNIVSIDVYYFSLLFYRPQQAKEHFKIRV
ncbi:hypothetical protein [Polaribacter marinivivus]|uniref:Uncharacterized protein n=1 Tax=Polaribacter marinivivus TaxID=1524260 RepID=A0ABV8RCJ4_9FLAO